MHIGGLSAVVAGAPRPTAPRFSFRALLNRGLPWFPAALAAGYTAWVVRRFSEIIDAVHLNPDAAFAPVLVRDLTSGPRGGTILVGEASHLTAIGFLYLTRSFPFRDVIWDAAPYLTFLAGLGLGAWACWRVAGPWAAAMVFTVGVCAEASVLLTVMAEGIRGHTFAAQAVMCAFLVAVAQRPDMARAKRMVVTAAAVATAGATVASDPLFLAVGLGPLVGAASLVWLSRRERLGRSLALLAAGVAAAAVVLAQVIWAVMHSAGVQKNYLADGYAAVGPGQVVLNLRVFVGHLRTLTHAAPRMAGEVTPVQLAMLLVVLAVTLYAFVLLAQLCRRRDDQTAGTDAALLAYTAFWVLSGVADLAAFSLSSFSSGPSDTSRYVIPAFLALAAIGPLWARRPGWRRPVAAACIGLFCVASLAARQDVFAYQRAPGLGSVYREGQHLLSFLDSQGLRYGYAGYLTSHQLTLLSDMRIHAYPVIACRQPVSDMLCPFFVNVRTAWYRPRPGVRSFVIQDAEVPLLFSPAPPQALGRPSQTRTFGTMTVSVFDYDIAARFSPPCIDPGGFICPAAR